MDGGGGTTAPTAEDGRVETGEGAPVAPVAHRRHRKSRIGRLKPSPPLAGPEVRCDRLLRCAEGALVLYEWRLNPFSLPYGGRRRQRAMFDDVVVDGFERLAQWGEQLFAEAAEEEVPN